MQRWGMWIVVGIAVSVGSLGTPRIAQAFLGASGADLVYTPVTPCRIIDTRAVGAGGPIGANTQRDFLVSGTTGFEAQGGTAGGCGIPEGATAAMLNFVAVNPSGQGDLRAWPFGQAVPFASIVNYNMMAPALNLANGVAVPLCDPATTTCTFDLSVQADVNGTQLVVDVLGFLQSTAPRSGSAGAANTFLGVNAGNFTMTGTLNTATGAFALLLNTTGEGNTATGVNALFTNTAGIQNTATGLSALQSNTEGVNNTATGAGALLSNTTGSSNTATGVNALFGNTTGGDNTATGVQALLVNTTGINNTATGRDALRSNTTGNNNTATGASALTNNTTARENTATGVDALFSNTTGDANTATGAFALLFNTTGVANTASGRGALATNTTGERNTAVGQGADVSAGNLVNATAIGFAAVVDASNKIRLGNCCVTLVETAGNLRVGAGTTTGCVQDGDGTVLAGTCISDARLKTGLRPFAPLLARLVQLQPVHFRWHAEEYPELQLGEGRSVGLVAQEVEQVLPELVTEDARGHKAVRYHLLPLMLIQALKEQQELIQRQQRDLEEVKATLMSLAAREATVQGLEKHPPENAELRSAWRPQSQ